MTGIVRSKLLVTQSIQDDKAGTPGFVATVVGLEVLFGQMPESLGGAESLAHYLLQKFGKDRTLRAMVVSGFIITRQIEQQDSGCNKSYPNLAN
ncbi:hypothetical protein [uncultured Draconibacterium sp.]|uniref:GntT/GntP/DsdX family permease n=1 Tax=uncultured Draconibacterium sp. TaxID=1573823 RepID=UPI0029C680D1|nr:hypothetical protein [uncultured Draconibacterium sp.]